jgi:predicted CopG family antitoxin
MGSDDIVKKHLARMNEALEELKKTSQIASDVAEALIEDKRRAIEVYED